MILQMKTIAPPPFDRREILRYAGCGAEDEVVLALLAECLDEVSDKLSYAVCYRILPVTLSEGVCDFSLFRLQSKGLFRNLAGCDKVLLFAATVGIGVDRLIAKYGRISPTKALLMQAIGAERIEALCDAFCQSLQEEAGWSLRPRFSPGYGDLPLETQKEIFALLQCEKHLGLCLTDSLLMSPTKSVTAFVGIGGN